MTVILLGIAWIFFYSIGEYVSKLWALTPSLRLALLTVACYSAGALAWLPALRAHGSLTILTTIFSVVATLAGALIGILVFHEPVTTKQLLGIGLALLAIVLLC